MTLEGGYKPAKEEEFSKEQLDWVEGLLEENYNKGINIYLIQHANISGYGPGDDVKEPYYEGGMNTELDSNASFKALLKEYKDMFRNIKPLIDEQIKQGKTYIDSIKYVIDSKGIVVDVNKILLALYKARENQLKYNNKLRELYKDKYNAKCWYF